VFKKNHVAFIEEQFTAKHFERKWQHTTCKLTMLFKAGDIYTIILDYKSECFGQFLKR